MNAFSPDLDQDVQTLKQCPPSLDAMTYGFIIPLPVNVEVDNMEFSWNWDVPQPSDGPGHTDIGLYSQSPLGFHSPAQAEGTPYFNEGVGFAKFNFFGQSSLKRATRFTSPIRRAVTTCRSGRSMVWSTRTHTMRSS